ncbi:hypothetical protein ACIRST_37920 [Kitasatospora sp. NPDC101447]|uniref:hypothetical protein n=1 Tax=Kitasatospora sp. NPDC101447 TaxID=3364102 RepID=UPI00382B8854
MLRRLLYPRAQRVRQGGGAQCAGSEAPFECRALDRIETVPDVLVGEEARSA